MSEQEIVMLAEMIKGISETVWDMALLRVYAQSLQYAVWAILTFVAGSAMMFVSVRIKEDEIRPFGWVSVILFFVLFGAFLSAFVGRAVAPEWYALKEIMVNLR